MVPKKISDNDRNQGDLFKVMLIDVVDPKHPMVTLANSINWEVIEKNIEPLFCADNGRPGLPIRMIVALLYLKYVNCLLFMDCFNIKIGVTILKLFFGSVSVSSRQHKLC